MTKLVYASFKGIEQSFSLIDLIPDTHAWIKDTQGLFIYGNRLFIERFGISSVQGLIGKSDYDIAPRHMAEGFRNDDESVLAGGRITDRLELISGDDGPVTWFLTSKWPIYDPVDHIIGSFGISRHLNKTEGDTVPFRELRAPIDYICRNFSKEISVESLASANNISVSALEKRFKKHLKKTPHQYLNDVRLDNARRLLFETAKSIGTIAHETGFSDHSHFTRAFTKRFGVNPSTARKSSPPV